MGRTVYIIQPVKDIFKSPIYWLKMDVISMHVIRWEIFRRRFLSYVPCFLFIYFYDSYGRTSLASILINCYLWGSCLSYETPAKNTKKPMEIAVVSNFWLLMASRGIKFGTFWSSVQCLNHSAMNAYHISFHLSLSMLIDYFITYCFQLNRATEHLYTLRLKKATMI